MAQQRSQRATPYVVVGPRASDAVGCALRNAYVRESLPNDMLVLLGQLNGSERSGI